MKILEQVSLAEHTTFKIGGPARFFGTVTNMDELGEALVFAKEKSIPLFVIGGGSNILFPDHGFSGLILKMDIKGFTCKEDGNSVLVSVGAGEPWDETVLQTVIRGLWGLENLSLIPGTVGASPVQNIGAYGVEVKDCIESVTTIDALTGTEKIFSNKECCFGYRTSIFKRSAYKKYIITKVTFRLSIKPKPNLAYKDIERFFDEKKITHPTQMDIRNAVIFIRTNKFPNLIEVGTAGSFWKNPIITKELYESLKKKFPLLPLFPVDKNNVKVPLAWILDNICGLKGFSQGSVGLFNKQPLVLTVQKNSRATDVDTFALYISQCVKEKTGISIEREVDDASSVILM